MNTPSADTFYEFTVKKHDSAAVGKYSVDGENESTIPDDGKIRLKAGQTAKLTRLEPGDYTVTETLPGQSNYENTWFSVNGGATQSGLTATVTVTSEREPVQGGWKTENGRLTQDSDGYFVYTVTKDQIGADGNITVDCDILAETIEADMQDNLNLWSSNFKVKFINETGVSIKYSDYSFDTVNWIPVGDVYNPDENPNILDTEVLSDQYSAGYSWGNAWQSTYTSIIDMINGAVPTSGSLNVTGFDGNNVRLIMSPARCINPAVISYFNSNPGRGELTGNSLSDNAQRITLLQMNAFPELIKKEFTFKNFEGNDITLPADENRTYSQFICSFYGVNSLSELTNAQKYNVLGTGSKGSPAMATDGQAHITTYYSNSAGSFENWCVPYSKLNDGSMNYFKSWGLMPRRIARGKTLKSGGQTFSETDAATYAFQNDYILMESDPDIIAMAYDYLYSRCMRFTLDSTNRAVLESIDNSSPDNAVGGIKDYIDKTPSANANVLASMNGGDYIRDGECINLDNVKGYIEVPNAWNHFRYFDFGFKIMFKTEGVPQTDVATVNFTNTYKSTENPPVITGEKGNLSVSKTVSGNGGDKTKEFTFTATLSDNSINGTFGNMTFVNGKAEFKLKDGQVKTAVGLKAGEEDTVTEKEADKDGYKTYALNNSGIIKANETVKAEFTNTKQKDSQTPSSQPSTPDKTTVKSPDTGDIGNVGNNFATAEICIVVVVALLFALLKIHVKFKKK